MATHNELGEQGERIAADFLVKKGYQIIRKNYRFKHQEVDIICLYDDLLVVVEVKTRNSHFLAGPEETVTKKKQRSIVKVTNHFMAEEELDLDVRFDIISIILNNSICEIDHLEDAFYPLI